MSITITNVTVRSFEVTKLAIEWQVQFNSPSDTAKIKYYIERSFSPTSEFALLNADPLIDKYFYVDSDIELRQKYREYYYRIKVIDENITPSETTYSEVKARLPLQLQSTTLVPLEIARNIRIYIEGTTNHRSPIGTSCLLFIRRTFGKFCDNCYDYLKGRCRLSDCKVCFGTTFDKGFLDPIPTYISLTTFPKQTTLEDTGEHQLTYTKADTSNWPVYSPGDVLVTKNNKRLRVIEVQPHETPEGILIKQDLTLLYLTPGDTEYNIPVVLDQFYD